MKVYQVVLAVVLICACQPKKAAKQVSIKGEVTIVKDALVLAGLNRPRTIRIYTPPGYAQSNEAYPVLYMHDGQNLFEDSTSFAGKWGIDETLDALSQSKGLNLIVVGIDNGGENRIHELTAWDHPRYGKAEGEQYMEFLVNDVKPFIDKNYRTKADREHTAIMGSSLGGLISHYAIYAYPDVFSKAGIFSPSYWRGNGPFEQVDGVELPDDTRLNFLVGGKEGESMVEPMQQMVRKILDKGHPTDQITSKVNPEGEHNEKFWRLEFREAVLWLFEK